MITIAALDPSIIDWSYLTNGVLAPTRTVVQIGEA